MHSVMVAYCQGRHVEVVENRRRLLDINGALFALYMQSR